MANKIKLRKKFITRFRVVKNTKVDPWGISIFLRRKLFLRSLHTYFKKIKNMRRKRNFSNVLLLDKSRGTIKKRIGRKTLYGKMLMNKQRLQKYYNIQRNKQFRKIFRNFKGFKNRPTVTKVLSFLELRLDSVLRRCYFVPTIQWARQSIIHGKLKLNNKIIQKPSVKVITNQEFVFSKNWFYIYNIQMFFKKLKKHIKPLPNFIMIDYKCFRFFIIENPKIEDIFYSFNGNFINLVQFYQNRRS